MTNKPIKPQPIRNNRIKRDFKRLLTLLAGADLSHIDEYAEVETIALRNGFVFDDAGNVKEVWHNAKHSRKN